MTDQATGAQGQGSAAGGQVDSQQGQQQAPAQQQQDQSGQQAQQQSGQGQQTQQQGGQQQQQEPKKIEVTEDVLKTMRDQIKTSHSKVDELVQQLQQANDQLALYQARSQLNPAAQQMPQQMQGPQGGQQQQSFQDPFQGMNDADMPTVGELKNAFGEMAQMMSSAGANNPQVDALVNTVRQLQVQMVDPNYQQTIQKYLPAMVNNDPLAYQMISRADNPMMAALNMAMKNPQYLSEQQAAAAGASQQQQAQQAGNGMPADQNGQQQQSPDLLTQLDQLLNNQGKPASPSAVSGAGAISAADKFAAMDDAAFDAHVQAVKNRGMG